MLQRDVGIGNSRYTFQRTSHDRTHVRRTPGHGVGYLATEAHPQGSKRIGSMMRWVPAPLEETGNRMTRLGGQPSWNGNPRWPNRNVEAISFHRQFAVERKQWLLPSRCTLTPHGTAGRTDPLSSARTAWPPFSGRGVTKRCLATSPGPSGYPYRVPRLASSFPPLSPPPAGACSPPAAPR